MLSLYEILKASKTGIAPDMWTALAGANFGGAGSGAEVKELTGIPPLSFTANGTPLLDFLISGNMSQTGTPTHDSPIQPQECGERTGNLYNKNATEWTLGILDDNGQPTGSTSSHYTTNYTEVSPETAYFLSGTISTTGSLRIYFYSSDKSWIGRTAQKTTGDFTTPQNCFYIRIQVTVTIDDTSDWMLNLGSTALPYEPYGYKIPILSNSTTNIYLGEVQTTRKIRKIVFIGSEDENWSGQAAGGGATRFRYTLANSVQADTAHLTSICTHLPLGVEGGTWNTDDIYTISNNYLWLRLDSSFTTVSALKSYLQQQYAAGTPVTVWYVLATPTTGIVNEPLRKIGDYADTLSMEQAGVSIPTLNKPNNTVIDVETTLKPSKMYVKYNGEGKRVYITADGKLYITSNNEIYILKR